MTVTIPVWLLWVLGVVGGLIVILLAIAGAYVIFNLKDWEFWR